MQIADFDHNAFTQQGTAEADKGLLVRFFYYTVPDNAATAEAGRPIFKEVEYVEIRIPGKRDAQVFRAATLADKQRFPDHYRAFKARVEMPETGWPLSEWPVISRSQAEELSFQNIKTVEQLANCADSSIGSIRGGYGLKERAKKALEAAKDPAEIFEKTRELEATNARLSEHNAELTEQVASLNKKVESLIDKLLGDNEPTAEAAPTIDHTVLDEADEQIVDEAGDVSETGERADATEEEAEAKTTEEAPEGEEPVKKRRSRGKK